MNPGEDIKRETPVIERKREWAHGDQGMGKNCGRANRPVFTDPNRVPKQCRDYYCTNEDWHSKGIVTRDAKTKKLLTRDGKRL